MRVRNEILQLHKAKQLKFATVPLPLRDQAVLYNIFPHVIEQIARPDIFEFVWKDADIRLDQDDMTHYPVVDEWEWTQAMACPLPHPHVWIETNVGLPDSPGHKVYIWDVERRGARSYTAIPLMFDPAKSSLGYFGIFIEVHPDEIDELGRVGMVGVGCRLDSYASKYDIEEFYDHADMLARFFRILCLPKVQIETDAPDPKLNKARARRGKEPLAIRCVVRIDPGSIVGERPGGQGQKHASPKEHHRRSHRRNYANGRVTTVRECVVNRGQGDVPPLPQHFSVG